MGSLSGRVALVTGASRGIGRAIALELAREGARVAVNFVTGGAEARQVAEEIAALGVAWDRRRVGQCTVSVRQPDMNAGTTGVLLIQADVSRSDDARRMVERVVQYWGRLDILVNNAGITRDRLLDSLSDEEWDAVIRTDLSSAYYCTSAALPIMAEQKYGRIVNVSSVIGQAGNVGQANYAAAKAGLIALTKSTALEVARRGITANAVCPGFTATDVVTAIPEDLQKEIMGKIPLGRFAQAEEIARAVRFLAADGDYITGQQINVNGGVYM